MTAPSPTLPLRRTLRICGALLLALAAAFAFCVWRAPEDATQGVIQKIFYLHVPLAFSAYLGFFLTALFGALFLWRGDERSDRLAAAAAEVGVLFCSLVLITGPIWAKGTWGRFWSWDARLTLTLLLWLIYVGYLLLRSFAEGGDRAARFAAVYGIAGIAVIPLNYFAIELSRGSLHPENLERGSLGAGMGLPFALGVVTSLVCFLFLLCLRIQVTALRRAEEQRLYASDA